MIGAQDFVQWSQNHNTLFRFLDLNEFYSGNDRVNWRLILKSIRDKRLPVLWLNHENWLSVALLLVDHEWNWLYLRLITVQWILHTIQNQNQHWFSILTLSGGYQYKISNRFSIMAEPYIEMPLSGIGFGKINLNSSGLLFTAVIKPFAAKK